MFISSEVVKWKLGTWEVLDRMPAYYSIGHLMIPGGDSKKPWGKYLVAMNKITKDRYLPDGSRAGAVGAAHRHQRRQDEDAARLPDDRRAALRAGDSGEPDQGQAGEVLQARREHAPVRRRRRRRRRASRARARTCTSKMIAIRSHFAPDNIEGVQVGDTVYFHVTNIEQDWDILHGFAVLGANNAELILQPGETRTMKWVPKAAGIYPFYCTDFCSALHQEMPGYIRVSPAGSTVALDGEHQREGATQLARVQAQRHAHKANAVADVDSPASGAIARRSGVSPSQWRTRFRLVESP